MAQRRLSKIDRGLYLSVAAAFWIFLVASAPHRVHHFFEQLPAASEHHAARLQAHEHADGAQRNLFPVKAASEVSHCREPDGVTEAKIILFFTDQYCRTGAAELRVAPAHGDVELRLAW